ncbi:hypothetical protein ACQPU1_11770 [Clostridium paraputrificum]|uniref:hypothetical protein n=1 Tax=Clostridium paraputrificum TaxID=29363 RepID=UPI003D34FCD9
MSLKCRSKLGDIIKKIFKHLAIILGTIILLLGIYFLIVFSGMTDTFNAVSVVFLVIIPLITYSFYKKKKLRGFYFIVLSILLIVVIDTSSKVNIKLYGAESLVMSLEERVNIMWTEDELSDEEKEVRDYNNQKEYGISKLSSYEIVEKKGNKIYYYNDTKENIKTVELIEEALSENSDKIEKIFNYSTPSEVHIVVRYDGSSGDVAYVNGVNILTIKPFNENLYSKEYFTNTILHEYAHVITLEKIVQFGGFGFGDMPTWFAEGLGTWVAVNIGTEQIDEEGLYKIDLVSEEYGITKSQVSNYYGSCYKVVNEIIKEVGLEGIERCIELWAKESSEDALKVVTGKILEDYYYIFD